MRKFAVAVICLGVLGACSEHDPILPGVRMPIFDTTEIDVMNINIPDLPDAIDMNVANCPYTRDENNIIWDGDRKIFSGFPTNNSVAGNPKPVCDSGYVYAGLTTGELVKVAPKSRKIMWIADVFRPSNMTGGASILDIVAPVVVRGNAVYAGGLGDAFCRINKTSGVKKWCLEIGTAQPFIITDNAAFVVATDNNLYAVRTSDGAVYWRMKIDAQAAPKYENKIITVGKQKIDAETGQIIK